jgi:hypothetical protein
MGKRLRGATFVAVAISSVALVGGCSTARSEAQKVYLIPQSSSLGRCTVSSGNGVPFDPMSAASWNRMNAANGAWARVSSWHISSKPKDPPQDRTVDVKARLQFLRGNRTVVRPTVGAFQQDAKSIAKALDARLDVFVAADLLAKAGPYVVAALALDQTGRLSWLGECAHQASDSAAGSLLRADVDQRRVGPAVRRWISNGDTDALVRTLKQG